MGAPANLCRQGPLRLPTARKEVLFFDALSVTNSDLS
jgi:hypothetical protein